jgi:ferredoxin
MLNRLKKRKMPLRQVQVDLGLCHFCGACVGACPVNIIFLRDADLIIGESCTHCERCIPACPLGALYLIDMPEKAPG